MALWLYGPMPMPHGHMAMRWSLCSLSCLLALQPPGSSASWLSRLPPLGARLLGFRPLAFIDMWLYGSVDLWILSLCISAGLWLRSFRACKAAFASVAFRLYIFLALRL